MPIYNGDTKIVIPGIEKGYFGNNLVYQVEPSPDRYAEIFINGNNYETPVNVVSIDCTISYINPLGDPITENISVVGWNPITRNVKVGSTVNITNIVVTNSYSPSYVGRYRVSEYINGAFVETYRGSKSQISIVANERQPSTNRCANIQALIM